MFVQFGEKLRNERFDSNNLKNTLFDFSMLKKIAMNRKKIFSQFLYNFVKSYLVKIRYKRSKKIVILTPHSIKRMLRIEKQTFLVFVQFGEKLCNERFDSNNPENTLFGLLKM